MDFSIGLPRLVAEVIRVCAFLVLFFVGMQMCSLYLEKCNVTVLCSLFVCRAVPL